MSTGALEILFEADARRAEAINRTVALLPIANAAVDCLSQVAHLDHPLAHASACRALLEAASSALGTFKVERSVAYDPFERFWRNPDERSHSRLLAYFINPLEEHGCGLYLLASSAKSVGKLAGLGELS